MKYKNLSLIVVVSSNNVIGLKNDLPWSIKEDLKLFKEITMNKDIIMGKNTFLSLPHIRPIEPSLHLYRWREGSNIYL